MACFIFKNLIHFDITELFLNKLYKADKNFWSIINEEMNQHQSTNYQLKNVALYETFLDILLAPNLSYSLPMFFM
jgi:hypothetical protein